MLFFIIVLLLLCGIAEAQDTFALPPNGTILTLPQGESLLLPVFEPKRVAVTDPAIADVVMVNTEQVLVNGIGIGTTSLQIWEKTGVSYYRVRVLPNPDALISELRKQLKLSDVRVYFINDHVVLDGVIEKSEDKTRAVKLASAYGQVIDLLQVAGAPGESELAAEIAQVIQRSGMEIRAVNGYIVLEGQATSLEERQRAEALAATFNRPVLNFLEIPLGVTPLDVLAEEITEHIDIPSIQVKVIAGETLLLEGSVQNPSLKERAAAIAHAWGKPVVNLIAVEEPPSEADKLADHGREAVTLEEVAALLGEIEADPVVDATPESAESSASDLSTMGVNPKDTGKEIEALVREMGEKIDDSAVTLRIIRDAVLLEGTVESELARERAVTIGNLYPLRVVDLLQVQDEPIPDLAQEREWLDRYVQDPNIQVTLVGKTALLEGVITSDMARKRAVAVARALGLEVVDLMEIDTEAMAQDPGDGDTDQRPDPEAAQAEIRKLRQLVPDMAAALAEDTLKVFELNGFIILEGQVPNEYRRLRAERIAATFQVPLIALIEVEAPQTERQAELDERVGADRKSQPIVEPPSALAGETEAQSGGSDPMPVSEPRLEEESQSNHVEEKMKSHLGEEIASTIGLPGVQVQMVKGAAVLDGTVSNELEAQGAAAIAGLFADVVINRLQVLPETGVPGPPLTEMVSDILNLPGVRVSQAGDKLLLEGVVDDQAEQERAVRVAGAFGKEVISFIKVEAPLQVLLKVRVVEASRVDMDRIGISWGSLERGVFIPDVVEIGELIIGEPLERLLPIGAKLEALIDEGKARLLAAPSLLTLSGREAEFLSGGEIPVIVPKDGELQINWKAYGVKLKILPVVVDEQSIEVRVEPEVSTLDWANAIRIESLALPAMKTRRTDTTVRINDGTTFVISGLLENSEALQVHKLPLLGDLPIIGKLFRSEQFMTDQTELIFFVTPYILKGNAPANNQELWRDETIEGREGPIDAPAITPANSR